MRLETYLNAYARAFCEYITDEYSGPRRRDRQYNKFRQHILDCSIFYQNKKIPYYIHAMASTIRKPPIDKPKKKRIIHNDETDFDGAGVS